MRAKIKWLSSQQGGRNALPTGPTYSTVARFEDDKDNWNKQAWSIVAKFSERPRTVHKTIAVIHFLVPDAPQNLLRPGSRFELIEGRRVVARGEVLPEHVKTMSKSERAAE